jgi:TPR repeat protein
MSCFRRSALRSNSVAMGMGVILLALPALARAGSNPDIPRLEAEAKRGSVKEEVELGAAYFAGRGVAQDEKRAAYWYEKAANSGDPSSQMQIGYFYQAGIGVTRDPAKAVRWFERVAAGGVISAKVNLGIAYLLGEGVRQDLAMAQDLFRQAFAQGNGLAACNLGEMYANGRGVEPDPVAAERWYEAGAKLHDPRAEFQLANLLWRRKKDVNELKRAIKLLHESAATGLVVAKHQLGILLVKHPELASSPQEPPALLKEAAEAGEWRSSVALGLLSRDGMAGTPVDAKAAYYHYRVATLQGGAEAGKVVENDLEALSAKLGPEQTAAIDADANAWYENHHLAMVFIIKNGMKWKDFPAYGVASPDAGMFAGRLILGDPSGPFTGGADHRAPVAR